MKTRNVAFARRTPAILAVLAAALVGAACLDDDITGTRTLSFSLSANPTTATVGQSITFTYNATGTGISAIVVDYGDGGLDTLTFSGPLEVAGTLNHAYQAAASYVATGQVIAVAGVASETVTITVN